MTKREIQILTLVKDGLTNQQIAEELEISPHTVQNHVRNILRTLDVSNRIQAVFKAIKEELL